MAMHGIEKKDYPHVSIMKKDINGHSLQIISRSYSPSTLVKEQKTNKKEKDKV